MLIVIESSVHSNFLQVSKYRLKIGSEGEKQSKGKRELTWRKAYFSWGMVIVPIIFMNGNPR